MMALQSGCFDLADVYKEECDFWLDVDYRNASWPESQQAYTVIEEYQRNSTVIFVKLRRLARVTVRLLCVTS